jgi:hypothetical protein
MPTQPAILGTARLGNFRLGYVPSVLADIRRTRVSVLLAGVAGRVREGSLRIADILNAAPNTCSLIVDSPAPTGTETVRVSIGVDPPRVLFAGALQTTDQAFEELPANPIYSCTAIDDTARANRRRPFGTFVTVSATTIAQSLVASYAPAFGISHIEAGLPTVSIIFDGGTDFIGCLSQLATAIGGYCKVEDLDVYLFLEETTDPPEALDAFNTTLLSDPPLTCSRDVSQLRTRVFGKGHGEAVLTDVLAGETILPVANGVMFGTVGGAGRALAGTTADGAQSQQIAYTGVLQGGAGSLVGPGTGPNVAPAASCGPGSGLGTGLYGYAYTHITAAGESLPGPLLSLPVGVTAAPSLAPVAGSALSGAGLDTGIHDYEATFVTGTGETTPSAVSVNVLTTAAFTPPIAPTVIQTFPGAGLIGTYKWAVTFITALGETVPGAQLTATTGSVAAVQVSIQVGPSGVTGRNLYRTINGGSQLKLVANIGNNTATAYNDGVVDGSLGANAPTLDTSGRAQVPITAIPLGGSGVTARKVYRRFNGTGTFKLVTTIADNTTTTYSDTTANASLGAAAPSSNTATANQVALTGLSIGPAGVTARKVYRTVVDGAQLKLLTTLANNTTTVYADSTADGSLGANVPTSDTSGLSFGGGQVNAGAAAIPTSSAAPFPASGWAIAGATVVRYTSIVGNTLTGVPTSGPGALLTTILYGSQILPAPCLTGVTGLVLAMAKGAPVHLWVQRDDLAAQAAQAVRDVVNGITPADGIYEGPPIADERRGEASITALCDANLALFSTPIITFNYCTRDLKTRSGKTVHIDLAGYPVGDYVIQEVAITEIGISAGLAPRFSVTASTVRFSLDDILRRLLTAQAA